MLFNFLIKDGEREKIYIKIKIKRDIVEKKMTKNIEEDEAELVCFCFFFKKKH